MRNRNAFSTIESVVFLCLISSGLVLFLSRVPEQVDPRIDSATSSFSHPLANLVRNSAATEEPSGWSIQPFSYWWTAGLLASMVIVIGLLRYRRSRQQPEIQNAILNKLQMQIQEHDGKQSSRLLEKQERIYRAFSGDSISLLRNEIVAGDIMSTSPTFVSPDTPKHRIVAQMRSSGIHHLLVCDDAGALIGIISDRDVSKKNCLSAAEMMTADPHTTNIDSDINDSISMMLTKRISCVPVLDGKQLVGVISITDIAVTLQCTLSLLSSLFSPAESDSGQGNNHSGHRRLVRTNA